MDLLANAGAGNHLLHNVNQIETHHSEADQLDSDLGQAQGSRIVEYA
jgi:hypothetical protein